MIEIDDSGISIIPKGYMWCSLCQALTPHSKQEGKYSFSCIVCSNIEYDEGHQCPNCGWVPDESDFEIPLVMTTPIHKKDCEYIKKRDLWEEEIKIKGDMAQITQAFPEENCDCPQVEIHPVPWMFNNWSRSAYWQAECYNAIEWGGDIRCRVCGTIYAYEDGNC